MKVKDIVNAVITELSQVPGIATQIYSASRIRQFVENAYQMEIDELWWPRYMVWQTVAVDSTTGLLMADIKGSISNVDEYESIRAVFPVGSSKQLPELPTSINPFSMAGGGQRLFITPDYTIPHRPFKVLPIGSSQSVEVHARQDSALPFNDNTDVFLDKLLLQCDAAWMYCVDDGTVPAQADKFQMMATVRRKKLKAALAQQPLLLDPRFPTGVDTLVDDNPFFVIDSDVLA